MQELDAIRGLAALSVVLFHYTWQYKKLFPDAAAVPFGLEGLGFGVEIFFGISGFVILMTLGRTRTAGDFIVSRFARLFPAYWIGILITTLAVNWAGLSQFVQPPWVVLINATMLQGHLLLPLVEAAYWSLSVELSFYAWMLLLWRLRGLDHIEWVAMAWIALKWLWWFVPDMSWRAGYFLIIDYFPFFAIGIAAYRVWNGDRRWAQQLPLLAFGFSTAVFIDPAGLWIVYLVSCAIFVLLTKGRLGVLGSGPLLWLGAISYSLYLVHQNVGYAIMQQLEKVGIVSWPAMFIALGAGLAIASLITYAVERPALRAIRRLWKQRTAV